MTAIRKRMTLNDSRKIHLDLDVPEEIPAGEVDLFVMITSTPRHVDREKDALAALREIAARGEVAKAISDPSAWQRDIRADRSLPGRV